MAFAVVPQSAAASVTWRVQEGAAGGAVTASGVYTAPSTTGAFHVVVTSAVDPSVGASATVTVTASPLPVTVSVSPATVSVPASGTQQFTATVSNASSGAVTWSLREGASCGTLSSTGLFTAPAWSAVCTVVATSVADGTRTGTAAVTVAGGTGTAVPGGAITTRTWTASGSPYRIFGDVFIPSGNRLTIQPGVQVRFQGHYRMEGPGVIDARGTSPAQRDILFTAENTSTGWYGIRIWNRTGALGTPPDVSDYHFENCIIEYVVKDRSSPRSFGDANYNDSRGALYVYGATTWSQGAPENYSGLKYSDLHLNGLMIRHSKSLGLASPVGGAACMYFNSVLGNPTTYSDMVFDDCRSDSFGAAFTQHHAGSITFLRSSFLNGVTTDKVAADSSGSIGYWDVTGPVTLDGCTLTNNSPATFATAGYPSVIVVNPVP
jgi:hypothetical protein